jgi:hypothetical protein
MIIKGKWLNSSEGQTVHDVYWGTGGMCRHVNVCVWVVWHTTVSCSWNECVHKHRHAWIFVPSTQELQSRLGQHCILNFVECGQAGDTVPGLAGAIDGSRACT